MLESQFMRNFIIETLIKFYVDIEYSGMRGQFYLKFWYRFNTNLVFWRLFRLNEFKEKLKELWGTEYLDKFVNAVLNDCGHCLEEGLEILKKIKKHEWEWENGI